MARLLAMAVLLATLTVNAAEWPQEPSSFRTIKFNVALSDQFPECSRSKSGGYMYAPQIACWQSDGQPNPYRHGAVMAEVFNLPDIGLEGDNPDSIKGLTSTTVGLIDRKVVLIYTAFNSGRYAGFLALLKEKYGSPTSETSVPMRTGAGVTVTGDEAVWQGPNVEITVTQYFEELKYSFLEVATISYLKLGRAESTDQREKQKAAL